MEEREDALSQRDKISMTELDPHSHNFVHYYPPTPGQQDFHHCEEKYLNLRTLGLIWANINLARISDHGQQYNLERKYINTVSIAPFSGSLNSSNLISEWYPEFEVAFRPYNSTAVDKFIPP